MFVGAQTAVGDADAVEADGLVVVDVVGDVVGPDAVAGAGVLRPHADADVGGTGALCGRGGSVGLVG